MLGGGAGRPVQSVGAGAVDLYRGLRTLYKGMAGTIDLYRDPPHEQNGRHD